jgi:sulfur carrier protein ThiS|tara:strand:- start:379 stop:621 length:243 start_codon:yes stop_codon:yes gene_type:complete
MPNATLIIIPGSGARSIQLDQNMTVAQLVCRENLHGRDIIINGTGVPSTRFETHIIPNDAEVFATGSVKGNSPNFIMHLL